MCCIVCVFVCMCGVSVLCMCDVCGVCVLYSMCGVYVFPCMHMWRPDAAISCLLLAHSSLFWRQSLIGPGALCFNQTG